MGIKGNQYQKIIFVVVFLVMVTIAVIIFSITKAPKEEITTKECKDIINLNEKNICFLKLAKEKNDMSYCEQISKAPNDILYYDCVGNVWEKEDCRYEKLVGNDYDGCIKEKAIKDNNPDLCYSIVAEQLTQDCRDYFILKDIDFCKRGESYDIYCIKRAAFLLDDCPLIKEKLGINVADDSCWMNQAIKENDVSFCNNIKDDSVWPMCLFHFDSADEIILYCGDENNIPLEEELIQEVIDFDFIKDDCIMAALSLEKFKYNKKLCNILTKRTTPSCK